MIKSRAAVAFEAKKPLEIVEVDVAMPKAGEVLLRVVASGVCHTDAYTLSGADPGERHLGTRFGRAQIGRAHV